MISWDAPNERYFQHGIDRGVIYVPGVDELVDWVSTDYLLIKNSIATGAPWFAGTHSVDGGNNTGWYFGVPVNTPVPWNGLIGVDEMGGGSSEIIYRDGKVIMADVEPSDFEATVSAYFFPDELAECLGMPAAAEGLYVDNQKPKRFGLTYRSLIGSGSAGDMFGYQIHLIYNCIASIGRRSRKTMTDTPEAMQFDFSIVCTPIKLTGFRPTAHYIIDTRTMNAGAIKDLEDILYGTGSGQGRMPTPTELFEMMNFGVFMRVHDEEDGSVKISGANKYFTENPDGSYTVTNINAVLDDDEYAISDGDNTIIVP